MQSKAERTKVERSLMEAFLLLLLLFCAWVMLSGMFYAFVEPSILLQGFQALLVPFQLLREGVYFEPLISLLLAFWLLAAMGLIAMKRVYRFWGIQLLSLLLAILIAAIITTLTDALFFRGLHAVSPFVPKMFQIFEQGLAGEDANFTFSLCVGLLVAGSGYLCFFIREFFHFGQLLGKARFANGLEVSKAKLFAHSGFVIGGSHYGPLVYAGYEPMIFVSGTGGGKSKAVVIPNMFELTHENIVVTDIKGEIYQATSRFRKTLGEVYRFEPASSKTHRYNPLGLVRKSHLDEDLDMIFKTIIPDSHEPLWADGSRSIAKMLSMYEILEKNETPTLAGIYQEICHPEFNEKVESIYPEIKTPRIANLFGKYLSAREKTRRDLLLSAQEYLSKFDSPNLAHATSGNDFDFYDLRHKPMSIYLIMPANTETYGTICAIFFEQMIRLCAAQNEPHENEYTINAMIDEFANLPKIPSIAKGVSFLRSYRIRVCAFVQQVSQLREVYGEHKKESFMAAPIKVAFNVTSFEDAKYFSALAGKTTIKIKNETLHQDLSMNLSTHRQHRPLLHPEEINHLRKKQMLIYVSGFNVIKGKKNFWFNNRHYKHLAGAI